MIGLADFTSDVRGLLASAPLPYPQPPDGRSPRFDRTVALRCAATWQRYAYDHGFGWVSGALSYGGRGLSAAHERLYERAVSQYLLPEVVQVLGSWWRAREVITAHATVDQRGTWLPRIVRGEQPVWWLDRDAATPEWAGLPTRAEPETGGWRVNGCKRAGAIEPASGLALVLCCTDPWGYGRSSATAFVLDLAEAPASARLTYVPSIGDEFEVRFADVEVSDAARLGAVGAGMDVVGRRTDRRVAAS